MGRQASATAVGGEWQHPLQPVILPLQIADLTSVPSARTCSSPGPGALRLCAPGAPLSPSYAVCKAPLAQPQSHKKLPGSVGSASAVGNSSIHESKEARRHLTLGGRLFLLPAAPAAHSCRLARPCRVI